MERTARRPRQVRLMRLRWRAYVRQRRRATWRRVVIFVLPASLIFIAPPIIDRVYAPPVPMSHIFGMALAVAGAWIIAVCWVVRDTRAGMRDLTGRRLGSRVCRGCRYDLRGMPSDAACPECGRPAPESV